MIFVFIFRNCLLLIALLSCCKSVNAQMPLFGKYWLNFTEFPPCDKSINYPIKFNFYSHKLTQFSTVLLGNITLNVTFDDSYKVAILFGKYDSMGLFKQNTHMMNFNNACSNLKAFLGKKVWKIYVDSFHLPKTCPWPKGTYSTSSGFNTALFSETSFPDQFFYGSYIIRVILPDKNNIVASCMLVNVGILPYPTQRPRAIL